MTSHAQPIRSTLARLWSIDKPLTAVGLVMLGALAASLVGLVVDPRTISGAPAWLKPAKFAISTAIYAFTLAWVFSYLSSWPRVRRIVGWTTASVFVLEVAIIDAQAWRGTTSHFNASTPVDMALFAAMGTAIVAQTLISILVATALWRERFANQALGWALRLGMVITIIGAASGGLMTRPTTAQLAEVRATGRMPAAGAHTVGAPDGGPGLPATGWSREHGDLRVPHFIGLHAIQVLPLIAFAIGRLTAIERRRVRLVVVAAGSYVGLFSIALSQALRGQSIVALDTTTSVALAGWLAVTLAAALVFGRATTFVARRGAPENSSPEDPGAPCSPPNRGRDSVPLSGSGRTSPAVHRSSRGRRGTRRPAAIEAS